jgi:fatty acid-binding protein DegV
MPLPAPARFRVIVDADACVPPEMRAALNIAVTPAEPELLLERVPIPRLALERGPFEADAIAQACAAVAEPGEGVIYIRTGDGHGSPEDAPEAARAAVEARGASFHLVETGAALMGAGWAAVVAAEVARDGGGIEAAAVAAGAAAGRTRVMAMLEHPEVVGLIAPSLYVTPARMVTTLDGDVVTTLAALPKRPDALGVLRDRFAAEVRAEDGRPRVAILHSSSGPAAEAMAQWCGKHLDLAEVVIAPITRHEGARLGPGFLAMAWLRAE